MRRLQEAKGEVEPRKLSKGQKRTAQLREAILNTVTETPCDIENLRRQIGAGNWESTKSLCLELAAEGKIHSLKTNRGWFFSKLS